jgi:hypothetical protein
MRGFRRCSSLSAVLLVLLAAAPSAAGESWAEDPVYVYYPRGDCRGDAIHVQLWNRKAASWVPHPVHPTVRLESCQLEDAGYLLHEIRYRCIEPPGTRLPPSWRIGVGVFDPEVMERCAPGQLSLPDGDLELNVVAPAPGERVTAPRMEVAIEGSVRIDGMDGSDYDALLMIDRSSATRDGDVDLLAAQLRSAKALLDGLLPRLGSVRVGIAAYPNVPLVPGSEHGSGGRRVVPLTDDRLALYAGLRELSLAGVSGLQSFGSAFDFALAELVGEHPRSGARPRARKVLVMAAHGLGDRPFGPAMAGDERALAGLDERLGHARARRVAVHLMALGGLSEQLPPAVEAIFERSEVRFQRVLRPALGSNFFASIRLPRVSRVVVANRTAGSVETPAAVTSGGRFATTVVAATGTNRLWARATLSDGATTEREWDFEFDDRMVKQIVLEAERERMRRVRQQRRLELDPAWSEPLDAGDPNRTSPRRTGPGSP